MIFGKTMESLCNRMYLEVVINPTCAKKLITRATTLHWDIITENLVSIRKQKHKLVVDRPIYLGFCIFELSKTTMYKFHYEEILSKYGSRAKLAYTDTDSFIYHIQTPDLYKDIADNLDAYGKSDYPVDHLLHSKTNAKVFDKLKDECSSLAPQEFVGLRAKMYSILLPNGKQNILRKVFRVDTS